MPELTLVVATHQSAPELPALLASAEAHLGDRCEIVVVDSGSSDDGPRFAATAGARVIELDGNPGFGAACNAGVEVASAPVTALVNPDIELLDDGLLRLATEACERRVLLAPRLLEPDGRPQRSSHPVPGRLDALVPALLPSVLLPRPLRLRAEPWRADERRPVGWAIAACLVAHTDLLRGLGPFDAGDFLFYEDLDLALRARAQGIGTEHCPDVAVRHLGGRSTARHYAAEPLDVKARRRREVVARRLGPEALVRDDLAQGLTFATRAAGHSLRRRTGGRERAQLRALRGARRTEAGTRAPGASGGAA
ncbi:MAG: glycosyltransferase family 2 protein [Solirubrobacterales bacterium]